MYSYLLYYYIIVDIICVNVYVYLPVFQISYLEGLLTNTELSYHQISNKKVYRVQSIFSEICQRLCLNDAQRRDRQVKSVGNDVSGLGDRSLLAKAAAAELSPRGLDKSSNPGMFGGRHGVVAGRRGPGTSTIAPPTGTALAAITAVAEAHEQAEVLRQELDRVKSGLTLLAQSMDKLVEIVRMDSRCCGGVLDALTTSVSSSSEVEEGPSSYRISRRRKGYDRVQGFALDNEDGNISNQDTGLADSSQHELQLPRRAATTTSATNPLQSSLGTSGGGSGSGSSSGSNNSGPSKSILALPTMLASSLGRRNDSGSSRLASKDANKFTIESVDDDEDDAM